MMFAPKSEGGKLTFKSLVEAIIRARRWKIALGPKEADSNEDVNNKTWYEDQDTLHFNVNAFKANNSGNAGLSKRAKFILMKNAWERTEEELELIQSVVDQMKSFEKYSNMVRRELTRVMHFETFEDGRVIVAEGHQGFSMYFIVAGGVVVQIQQEDVRTKEKRTLVVSEMSAGSSFGELALIQDCKRTATIVCKGTSQFLRVDKPDFDMVLRRSYEKEWNDRLQILMQIPFFKKWDEQELKNINLNCRVVQYLSESVILGDISDTPENLFFIATGTCRIIKKVRILETTSHLSENKKMLSLPTSDIEITDDDTSRKTTDRFLQIGMIFRGEFFGVGENLKDTYIVAFGRVDCILIPRHAILMLERMGSSKPRQSEIMQSNTRRYMLQVASERILDTNEAFDKWMINMRWKNYKNKLVQDVISRRTLHPMKQTKPNLHIHHEKMLNNNKKIKKTVSRM